VELKADPWRPDHGVGAEVSFDGELAHAVIDPAIETADWSQAIDPGPCPPGPLIFVDGVMRTEMRVMAVDGNERAWGLIGSYAAGGVLCNGTASFVAEDRPIGRSLLMGGRLEAYDLEVPVGRSQLVFTHKPVTDETPTGLRRGLQRQMLEAEAKLAAELSGPALVLADGPLNLSSDPRAEVVGVVKRMVSAYLVGNEAALLPKLRPGERTPLFALGNNALDRFAWYQRLLPQDRSWHELAGLVRCEVRMELGPAKAARIADLIACQLPRFAGRPGLDPRAPQNLTPVGALEARLKHRLGSSTFIGRAILKNIAKGDRDG
jgi:hypothetical protein